GAAARPLLHAGRGRPCEDRPALLGELEARALPPARPVEPPRRPLEVPLPVEAHHMKLPSPPGLRRKPPRPGAQPPKNGNRINGAPGPTKKEVKQAQRANLKQQALEVPISMLGWLDERTGSTPFLRAFLFRKVPKGTN